MSEAREVDVARSLDQFFAVVREEAIANPKFASRLADALGHTVVFRGDEAKYAVDPLQVATQGEDEFRRTFLSFSAKDLKAITSDFDLATKADLKGKTRPPQIVDVMWTGALSKVRDRGLQR